MVFPPIPVYLDPPANWNQQPAAGHHQHAIGAAASDGGRDARFPPPQPRPEGNMAAAAARPVSMADRARLEKVPQPEPGLKCPRCDSTNTKFCYFNNYSLSQPRHFCKTCRRYWTRGGALRNVPVGGGCRRNKRSKSGSGSKPSAPSVDRRQTGTVVTGAAASAIPSTIPPQQHLPFMPSLLPEADYGAAAASIGALGFSGIHPVEPTGFHGGGGGGLGGGLEQQWRQMQQVQQFPFLSGMEPPVGPHSLGLFALNRHGMTEAGAEGLAGHLSPSPAGSAVPNSHLAPVKMEEEDAGALNPQKQYLGFARDNGHYWGSINGGIGGGGGWTDLSGFTSASSCSNIF